MKIPLIIAATLLGITGAYASAPQSPLAAEPIPAACTQKVAATPHFYQRDPRWDLDIAGETYCVPSSVSDSFVYFAANGYSALLPVDPQYLSTENPNRELAQAELIKKLASPDFMNTKSGAGHGTTPSEALYAVRRYVERSGYLCQRLEYEGWRQLHKEKDEQLANAPDLNWIKSAIADPNGAVWLEIGYYTHGRLPGEWIRADGHTVAAVGYGTDGQNLNPNILLVDNPAVGRLTAAAQASGKVRPFTLADLLMTISPAGPMQVATPQMKAPRNVTGLFQISGPGVPYNHKKSDAAFLDGAIVLIIAKQP